MMEIIKYPLSENEMNRLFEEAIYDSGLKYTCKNLFTAGVENEAELVMAIIKSIQVVRQSGLTPQHHFKHLFVTSIETGKTFNDWRMSRMGFLLVLMHSGGNSELVNRWKIKMASAYK